jgi:hypothetical protein
MHYPDVVLKTNSDKLIEQISMLYSGFISCFNNEILSPEQQINSYNSSDNHLEIIVERIDDDMSILKYNNQIFQTDTPLQVIEGILFENINIQDGIFALHAAAVEYKEKAYALAAATTTGKTTLVSYLIHNGFNYITDDCVLIDKSNLSVYPYCTSIHIRDGGIEVLKKYNISPRNMYHLTDKTMQRHIFIPDNCISKPIPLGGILFIKRSEHENSVYDISASECINTLMRSPITDYRVTSNYIKFMSQLSKVKCKKVVYKDMEFIAEYIKAEASNNG